MRFIFLLLIFFSFSVKAQPPCSGLGATAQTAISVCGIGNYTQVSLPPCTGVQLPLISGPQCPGDNSLMTDNSIWYKIHIYQTGTLGFTITPSLPSDDYDWVLFDVTNRNPQDVYTSNLVVAYNQCVTTGSTGCSATGFNTFNCQASQSLPTVSNFNSLFPVTLGSDYLLMVISLPFSGPTFGLNISGGTAVVTNSAAPTITSINTVGCNTSQLNVTLSEDIKCTGINPFVSQFSIPGATITSVTSLCNSGTNAVSSFIVNLLNPLSPGAQTLNVNSNTLFDVCDNPMTTLNYPFTAPIVPAAPTVTPTVTYCLSAAATQLTATGTNLLWYTTATGGTGIATAPTPSTAIAGTTNYYVSQSSGTCESVRSLIAVTVLSIIPTPVVTTPVNFCQNGASATLTATGTNLKWYTSASGGVASTTAPTPPTTVSGIILYYVSQTISGCESQRALVTVNINITPLPPVVVSPFSVCQGSTPTPLTATGTNLLWYNTLIGGTGSTTAPSPATTSLGTIVYYVTQSVGICESPREDIIVNVDVSPITPTVVTNTLAYCQFQFAPPLSATGSNLMWYTVPTGGTGTSVTPVPLTSVAGVTNYYVASGNGACQSPRVQITVTISPGPNTPVVTTPINVCQGILPAPVISVTPSAGATLRWYTVPTGGTSSSIVPTINTAIASNTIHYVSQFIGACESPRAAIVVNVNPAPLAPIVTPSVTYCQNQTPAQLTASGTNLLWYANSSGGIGTAIAPTPNTSITGTTIFYVSQTVTGCEGPRVGITVNVNPAPSSAPIVVTPLNYCVGSATSPLQAAGTNLLWFTSLTGTGSSIVPTPSSTIAGITNYYVANSIGTCEGPKATIVVNVLAYPTAPTVVTPQVFCPGSTASPLTAVGTNLLWFTGPIGGVGSTTAPTPNTATLGTTTFYVSQSNGNCEGPRTPIVVDISNPLSVAIGIDETICEGSSVTFNPTVTPAGATFQWRPLGTIPASTISNITLLGTTVSPVDDAFYVLKANIGSCEKEDTVKVNVIWKPIVDAGINTAICLGDSALLQGSLSHSTGPTLATYLWSPIDSVRDITNAQTYVNPTKTTWYKLTASTTIAGYGCAFDIYDSVKVTLQANVIAFAGNDTIAVKNVPHQLNASGGVNYSWFSPTANIVNPLIKNPKAILNNDAVFYLEVKDAIGCVGYDTMFIKVYEGPTYYVPNAFTPNGDGVNDIFRAIPAGLANTVYFRVFDRFGVLLFETNQYLKGWDGTYKGKPQPNGTYIWMVAGTDRNFKKVEMKGNVIIIR